MRAFSRTVPVTQRHTVDRHHLEADGMGSYKATLRPGTERSDPWSLVGTLRCQHGDRLIVLYGRGVATVEIAPRGAVL